MPCAACSGLSGSGPTAAFQCAGPAQRMCACVVVCQQGTVVTEEHLSLGRQHLACSRLSSSPQAHQPSPLPPASAHASSLNSLLTCRLCRGCMLCCAVLCADTCRYNGARTSDQFLDFLKKKLEEDKGFARVEELDKLVKDFVGADKKVGGCFIGGAV